MFQRKLSESEIDIERLHLRVQAATLFPEKIPLYRMVSALFRRLSAAVSCAAS
jgi:hypothetical protein